MSNFRVTVNNVTYDLQDLMVYSSDVPDYSNVWLIGGLYTNLGNTSTLSSKYPWIYDTNPIQRIKTPTILKTLDTGKQWLLHDYALHVPENSNFLYYSDLWYYLDYPSASSIVSATYSKTSDGTQTDVHIIDANGRLWSYSSTNTYGQAGNGTTTNVFNQQIGTLTNWKKIVSSTYSDSTYAIKTDGTLWSWGRNQYGQLGLGDTLNRSSPVQVGNLTDWSSVSTSGNSCYAVKTDGTAWTWGLNQFGQLGLSDTLNRSSPTKVGTSSNWKKIASSIGLSTHQTGVLAIRTDGTLWGWGANKLTQLTGLPNSSTPVQIGTMTDWSDVCGGEYAANMVLLKTNGSLWTIGDNQNGNLGDGSTVLKSSPIQVGYDLNWTEIFNGNFARKIS